MEAQAYEYWLNCIPGIGDGTIEKLLSAFGTPEEVYRAGEEALIKYLTAKQLEALLDMRRNRNLQEEYDRLKEQKIRFLTITSKDYPEKLKNIPNPPYGIFLKGRLPSEESLAVAVVGARECSEYGRYIAQELGSCFAKAGISVISGMARGIDGISQQAALAAGGVSFAVLGSGVDVCYPLQNRPLYEELLKKGGILSPYPPGTKPSPAHFPPRNRIVSGLADVLIVVEARLKSGTLITVDMALEQGREVYAVPGRLTDRLSDGCNRLIRQGAGIFLSPQDFLMEMEQMFPGKTVKSAEKVLKRSEDGAPKVEKGPEAGLLNALDYYPRSVEDLRSAACCGASYGEVLKILMKLCLMGQAEQVGAGYFQKTGGQEKL